MKKTFSLISLAALAAHEHQHHLQPNPQGDQEKVGKLEEEAKALAAYVRVTARISQVPMLRWTLEPQQKQAKLTIRYEVESSLLNVQPSNGQPFVAIGSGEDQSNLLAVQVSNRPRLAKSIANVVRDYQDHRFALFNRYVTRDSLGCVFAYMKHDPIIRIRVVFAWDHNHLMFSIYTTKYYLGLLDGDELIAEIDAIGDSLWEDRSSRPGRSPSLNLYEAVVLEL